MVAALRIEPRRYRRFPREMRRAQIIACASRLFSERNYSSVSTTEIAQAAGINRGLLHHYFGTKRDLYLEVVREMVRVPPPPVPEDTAGLTVEEVWGLFLDAWLTMVEQHRGTWLAAVGGEGFGRDRQVERVLEGAREAMVERIIEVTGEDSASAGTIELKALVRAWIGMAEAATKEWLLRRSLSRDQVRVLLMDSAAIWRRDVLPRVIEAGRGRS